MKFVLLIKSALNLVVIMHHLSVALLEARAFAIDAIKFGEDEVKASLETLVVPSQLG